MAYGTEAVMALEIDHSVLLPAILVWHPLSPSMLHQQGQVHYFVSSTRGKAGY